MAFQSKSRLTNLVIKKMVDSCTFVRISVLAQNCFFEVKLKCLTGTAESAGFLGSQTLQDEAKIKTVTQLHTNDFTLYQQHIRDEGTNSAGIPLRSLLLSPLQTNRRKAARVRLLQYEASKQKSLWSSTNTRSSSFIPRQRPHPPFCRYLWLWSKISHFHALLLQRQACPNDITSPPCFLLASQTTSA